MISVLVLTSNFQDILREGGREEGREMEGDRDRDYVNGFSVWSDCRRAEEVSGRRLRAAERTYESCHCK